MSYLKSPCSALDEYGDFGGWRMNTASFVVRRMSRQNADHGNFLPRPAIHIKLRSIC
jgi:hypothetical protein